MLSKEDLSPLEAQVWEAIETQVPVGPTDRRISDQPEDWGEDRTVRAQLIRQLLLDDRRGRGNQRRGLRLQGVRIAGSLDLASASIDSALILSGCFLDHPVVLDGVDGHSVQLKSCQLKAGLHAQELRLRSGLDLRSTVVHGEVRLGAAQINGTLLMTDCHIINSGETALSGYGLEVRGDVLCDGLHAEGELRLLAAEIGGQLSLSSARLENSGGFALTADGIRVARDIFCNEGFSASGGVRLPGADVGGQVTFSEAEVINPRGTAVAFDGARVGEDVLFIRRFRAEGLISADRVVVGGNLICGDQVDCQDGLSIVGTEIRGDILLQAGEFGATNKVGLNAYQIVVGGDLRCDRTRVIGEMVLAGAKIAGSVSLSDAELVNPESTAITGDLLRVGGTMNCRGVNALGQVRLPNAEIGSQLVFSDSKLRNASAPALIGGGLHVKTDLIAKNMEVVGQIDLRGSHIEGQLSLRGSTVLNRPDVAFLSDRAVVEHDVFLDHTHIQGGVSCVGMRVGGQLSFEQAIIVNSQGIALRLVSVSADQVVMQFAETPVGGVDLHHAHVRSVLDDPQTWPPVLLLHGFSYDLLQTPLDAKSRLRWLGPSQEERYLPDVYSQLAGVLRSLGRGQDARNILIARERRRRREVNRLGKLWSDLLWIIVGYGYRDWLAGLWLLGFLIVGSVIFSLAWPSGFEALKTPAPAFNPVAYTVDTLLPVIDLGQQSAWTPRGAFRWISWSLVLVGWGLATAVLAALAGLLNRD